MILIHSECGGELEIDRSAPVELIDNGRVTELYYPIRCIGCNTKLGMLPNVDMAHKFVTDREIRRNYAPS